jgi:hypothetical protein
MEELMTYVEQEKWRETEALTWWRSPSSPIMVLLGMTFKVSMTLRDVHRTMTEKYGIPTWAAYSLFALLTIIVGVAIGALIVFVADLILRRQQYPGEQNLKDKDVSKKEDTKPGKDPLAVGVKAATDDDSSGSLTKRKVKASTD